MAGGSLACQPLPSPLLYCAITKDRVWSDSPSFRVRELCVECDVIDHNP